VPPVRLLTTRRGPAALTRRVSGGRSNALRLRCYALCPGVNWASGGKEDFPMMQANDSRVKSTKSSIVTNRSTATVQTVRSNTSTKPRNWDALSQARSLGILVLMVGSRTRGRNDMAVVSHGLPDAQRCVRPIRSAPV
jgi:hypothetical protein